MPTVWFDKQAFKVFSTMPRSDRDALLKIVEETFIDLGPLAKRLARDPAAYEGAAASRTFWIKRNNFRLRHDPRADLWVLNRVRGERNPAAPPDEPPPAAPGGARARGAGPASAAGRGALRRGGRGPRAQTRAAGDFISAKLHHFVQIALRIAARLNLRPRRRELEMEDGIARLEYLRMRSLETMGFNSDGLTPVRFGEAGIEVLSAARPCESPIWLRDVQNGRLQKNKMKSSTFDLRAKKRFLRSPPGSGQRDARFASTAFDASPGEDRPLSIFSRHKPPQRRRTGH
ncbi:MAG: hypothetical protein AB7J28_02810 [Hyphomonadaceae bacterium]